MSKLLDNWYQHTQSDSYQKSLVPDQLDDLKPQLNQQVEDYQVQNLPQQQEGGRYLAQAHSDYKPSKMEIALAKAGLTEDPVAQVLARIMTEAMTVTPDWQPIEDFKAKLDAIKVWLKMKNNWPDTIIAIQNVFWEWPTL